LNWRVTDRVMAAEFLSRIGARVSANEKGRPGGAARMTRGVMADYHSVQQVVLAGAHRSSSPTIKGTAIPGSRVSFRITAVRTLPAELRG